MVIATNTNRSGDRKGAVFGSYSLYNGFSRKTDNHVLWHIRPYSCKAGRASVKLSGTSFTCQDFRRCVSSEQEEVRKFLALQLRITVVHRPLETCSRVHCRSLWKRRFQLSECCCCDTTVVVVFRAVINSCRSGISSSDYSVLSAGAKMLGENGKISFDVQ